jgi:hypothetical protein
LRLFLVLLLTLPCQTKHAETVRKLDADDSPK